MGEPTQRAIEDCGRWLAACLTYGWAKTDLDKLEELWWEHHDEQGRLKGA